MGLSKKLPEKLLSFFIFFFSSSRSVCSTHFPLLIKIFTWNSKSTFGSTVLPVPVLLGRGLDLGLTVDCLVVLDDSWEPSGSNDSSSSSSSMVFSLDKKFLCVLGRSARIKLASWSVAILNLATSSSESFRISRRNSGSSAVGDGMHTDLDLAAKSLFVWVLVVLLPGPRPNFSLK